MLALGARGLLRGGLSELCLSYRGDGWFERLRVKSEQPMRHITPNLGLDSVGAACRGSAVCIKFVMPGRSLVTRPHISRCLPRVSVTMLPDSWINHIHRVGFSCAYVPLFNSSSSIHSEHHDRFCHRRSRTVIAARTCHQQSLQQAPSRNRP